MAQSVSNFRKTVWKFYRSRGRHTLPWRSTRDPYKILVAEVMLQQTQVERVLPFYAEFTRRFPTTKKLAAASLASVLRAWQGLGYNRRAKLLRQAAQIVEEKYGGTFPKKIEELESLPGIGRYTARAVAAFAHNANVVLVETNIRTVVIHHFFSRRSDVEDTELVEVLAKALPKGRAREWYSALMDYGAFLKRSNISYNHRSRHYRVQSTFKGSMREARGAILRKLILGSSSPGELAGLLGSSRRAQMRTALRSLLLERLIEKKGECFTLAK